MHAPQAAGFLPRDHRGHGQPTPSAEGSHKIGLQQRQLAGRRSPGQELVMHDGAEVGPRESRLEKLLEEEQGRGLSQGVDVDVRIDRVFRHIGVSNSLS